eukprot:m.37571 g.37571  ORF g.37571 m.37571 type:complete len:60 (+) comp11394_c0_seq3:2207-2386(+)
MDAPATRATGQTSTQQGAFCQHVVSIRLHSGAFYLTTLKQKETTLFLYMYMQALLEVAD